jgi:hypothetical protein
MHADIQTRELNACMRSIENVLGRVQTTLTDAHCSLTEYLLDYFSSYREKPLGNYEMLPLMESQETHPMESGGIPWDLYSM